MGLGSTAKKIQIVSERAEQVYKQIQELQQRIIHLERKLEDTHDTATALDHRIEENRALLVAIAEEQGVDVDQVTTQAAIDDADELARDDEAAAGADGGRTRETPPQGAE
ncbi:MULTISPECIES: DUF5798 family protein [Saliphagus]|uniref:DUF5798 family protein n=1 Tax=Saliphagus infecundisoli TaxID=1849069 RepID=A0ABD5QAL8_9EURY|nr:MULTISPECIES: DUF5798 family protein [Saliphagus]